MALASSGPTQSVAVSLAAILATVAYAGFLPILGFCVAALVGIYDGSLHHTVHIAADWFTIGGAGGFKSWADGRT